MANAQATYKGLPLIGRKEAVDPKQQFMAELNRRFQALEACCAAHAKALGLLAVEIAKLQDRRRVAHRSPKKASGVHPGVRGRGR